jgi:hypothetical protein
VCPHLSDGSLSAPPRRPTIAVEWLAVLLRIREVPSSNLVSESISLYFPQPFHVHSGILPQNRPRPWIVVFWIVIRCSLVGIYQCFGCMSPPSSWYTALQTRGSRSIFSPPWKSRFRLRWLLCTFFSVHHTESSYHAMLHKLCNWKSVIKQPKNQMVSTLFMDMRIT